MDYFSAYEAMDVHRLMLTDAPRMAAYRAAIEALDLRGKTVLDVGAGTGILSLVSHSLDNTTVRLMLPNAAAHPVGRSPGRGTCVCSGG
jgi:2-polyprenyl-3-methyl-5-hydroxy-6-metoxy-1,4-benzoquinol methylase